jgi:uncharacterized protein YrrD
MTKDARDLLNKAVLTISTGMQIGTVDQLLFEPGQHMLYGIVVKPRDKGEPQLVVRSGSVRSYGDQAITVQSEADATAFDADRKARELAGDGGHLGGLRVVTEDGNELGTVDTVEINDDGSIAAYRTGGGMLGLKSGKEIRPEQIVSAGPDAIIVSSAVAHQDAGSKDQPH